MAKFDVAYNLTNGNEGAFANNPSDDGGMTYRGIARKFWGSWAGWAHIDKALSTLTIQPSYETDAYEAWVKIVNARLQAVPALQSLVAIFYRANFWDNQRLDDIKNQDVANWIYDHVVNAGGRGARWAQLAASVTPDGDIGPKSIAAINATNATTFLSRAADIAAAYRLDKAKEKPNQIQFLVSWLRRDGQSKEIIAMVRAAAKDGRLDEKEVATLKTAMESTA